MRRLGPRAAMRASFLALLALFLLASRALGQAGPGAADINPAPPQAGDPDPRPRVTFRWGDHPSLRVGDMLRIDFRARFQGDLRGSDADLEEDDSEVDIARRRIGIDGEVAT